jgi:hypothetical protein
VTVVVEESSKAKETREWEDRADFNLPMSLRVRVVDRGGGEGTGFMEQEAKVTVEVLF